MEGAHNAESNDNAPQQDIQSNEPEQANDIVPVNGNLVNGNGDGDEPELRRLTSNVWPHFSRVRVGEIMKARCKYCRKLLGGETHNGTSHLRNHLRNSCIQKKIHDGQQRILGPNYNPTGPPQLAASQYKADVARKELCSMILVHEYPLSIVEHLGFKRFCCALQPQFTVPCRNTIKKDILTLYGVERDRFQRIVDGNLGRVAITTDLWTATNQKMGYMAVTGHYIDNSWKLKSILLRFMYVPAPHTSERLADRLFDCLLDWNIDGKLSSITLDNCTTNDAMIPQLKNKLQLADLLLDGSLMHMRCAAHILNLIVRDGLDIIKDGITLVRESVVYWNSTPKRVQIFYETAKQLRVVTEKKLVLDCPTRWNSTYAMLSHAKPYKEVFFRLKQRDNQYNSVPTNAHWEFASVVIDKLEIFSDITKLFSGNKYPTANLFFPKICDLRLKLIEWCADSNPVISAMAHNMWLKFTKYWDDIHLVLAVSVILDPRYKLHVIDYYAAKFGSTDNELVSDNIKQILCNLIMEYQSKAEKKAAPIGPSSSSGSTSVLDNDLDFELFVRQRKKSKATLVASELDHYLAEEVLPRKQGPEEEVFDLLMWWKFHGLKYPTLQAIARDFMAIPVTSVASESAFSSGGRLLDPHRSRLHYSTVEAMMCTRSWIMEDLQQGNYEHLVLQIC